MMWARRWSRVTCWKVRLVGGDEVHDTEKLTWIRDELDEGRLRFGWSGEGSDLRELERKRADGMTLSDRESETWKKGHKLITEMEKGDLVFTPGVPNGNHFAVAHVSGEYRFDPNGASRWRGHVLPVTPLVSSVHRLSPSVSARVVSSISNPRSITRMGAPWGDVQRLLGAADAESLDIASPPMERIDELARGATRAISETLASEFRGKGFEVPVRRLLEALYTDAEVKHARQLDIAGIDILVHLSDPLGFERDIAVQVKHWTHEPDTTALRDEALDAIRRAKERHPEVDAGLVFTLLDTIPPETQREADRLSEQLGIDVVVLGLDQAAPLFLRHLPALSPNTTSG